MDKRTLPPRTMADKQPRLPDNEVTATARNNAKTRWLLYDWAAIEDLELLVHSLYALR